MIILMSKDDQPSMLNNEHSDTICFFFAKLNNDDELQIDASYKIMSFIKNKCYDVIF